MNELQNRLLEMLTWLDQFIRKHDLKYFIYGGTMLGAARHQGFIPWDDDVDIAMPRKDYEILCKLLIEPVDHYVIETIHNGAKDFFYTYAKFYDINTSMIELLRTKIKRGVSIDIFPLDGIGNTREEALRNYKKIDRLNMFLMMRICAYRKDRKWYKNLSIALARVLPSFIIDERKIALLIDRKNKKYDYDMNQYFGLLMSTYRQRDIHKKELMGTPTEYKFENILVLGPEKFDEYLEETYGNWRKLPPMDKRHSVHDYIELNLEKSYLL